MFVKFSSEAYENITYFNDIAKRLLSLLGHSGSVPGALKASELPAALVRLQQGLEQDKKAHPASNNADDGEAEISLSTRAIPLIHLVQASIAQDCDVLWVESRSPD
jgi:hypothetical protein